MKRPTALIIIDGLGLSEDIRGNAVYAADTPNLDSYLKNYPNTKVSASGMAVGLPEGQMGNSEVGHTNIGAGRIVYQDLTRITKEINEGSFFENPALLKAMENCKKNGSALHFMGLLSDGGVHSHNTHLYALVELAASHGLKEVYIHGFLDGRDVSPTSGAGYTQELEKVMKEKGTGKIASIMGRYYAMDRDNRWDRVEKAYAAMVYGEGEEGADPVEYIKSSYDKGVTDEFVIPVVFSEEGRIKTGDSVICINFRPDRAREITRAFVDPDFSGFDRKSGFFPLCYVCMTQYDAQIPNVDVAFSPQSLENTFGEYLSKQGLKQLRIAETEKYAHVTFFFNGGAEDPLAGEDRLLIPSPKVATYDLKPEMSALEVTQAVLEQIAADTYDSIILNYANCDMVGHTGIFESAVSAVKTVDECVGKVVDAVLEKGGVAVITSDHGNADKMLEDGSDDVFTAHTTNPVPLIVIGKNAKLREGGVLADIAPTLLHIMGLEKPDEMTGESIIIK